MMPSLPAAMRFGATLLAAVFWLIPSTGNAQFLGQMRTPAGGPGGAPFYGIGVPGQFGFPGGFGPQIGTHPGTFGLPGGLFPFLGGKPYGIPGGLDILNGLGPFSDSRTNTSREPILSMYNGQTSLLQIQDFQWFTTNVQVVQSGGSVVFVPQQQPIPSGMNWPIQAVGSPDGKYTRMSVAPTMANPTQGPLYPITTFITPTYAGGAQGQPVPFTQWVTQPGLNTTSLQTTVSQPTGGRTLLGGQRNQYTGRDGFGPPMFSMIPYLSRNTSYIGSGYNTGIMPLMAPRVNLFGQ